MLVHAPVSELELHLHCGRIVVMVRFAGQIKKPKHHGVTNYSRNKVASIDPGVAVHGTDSDFNCIDEHE